MEAVTDEELIAVAGSVLNRQRIGDAYVADVGCALLSTTGRVYTGASVGTYLGICAEQGAVSALVTREAPVVHTIVAVWKDEEGLAHVLRPCGRCREFLSQLSDDNHQTRVILGPGHVLMLGELLPYHGWHVERA